MQGSKETGTVVGGFGLDLAVLSRSDHARSGI